MCNVYRLKLLPVHALLYEVLNDFDHGSIILSKGEIRVIAMGAGAKGGGNSEAGNGIVFDNTIEYPQCEEFKLIA